MARIIIQPSGKAVEWNREDTALMALEKAGYALPNNCRAGACGECKVKVLKGEYDQGMVLDMALSEEERKNGYGLMCMAKQISDEMEIEWLDAEARPKLFPPREGALFVLVDKRDLTPRTLELRLRPVGKAIRYWPGQYVRLGDPRAGIPMRAYSIANAPQSTGEITLQVARAEGGVTSTWIADTVKQGDTLKINGAYGSFIGDPSAETPVLCLAAGTGLAPVLDLSEAALRRGYRKRVEIIFSARTESDVYGLGMMAWWRTKHRNFDYKVTLTREHKPGFLHGRVTALLPRLHPDLSATSVFVAGSTAFVDDCVALTKSLGAREQLTHKEGFFEIQDARNQGRPG